MSDARVVGFTGDHDGQRHARVHRTATLCGFEGGGARRQGQDAGGGVLGNGGGDAVGGRDGGLLVVSEFPGRGHSNEIEGTGVIHGVRQGSAHGGRTHHDGDDEGHTDEDRRASRGGATGVAHRVLTGHGGQHAREDHAERPSESGQQDGDRNHRTEKGHERSAEGQHELLAGTIQAPRVRNERATRRSDKDSEDEAQGVLLPGPSPGLVHGREGRDRGNAGGRTRREDTNQSREQGRTQPREGELPDGDPDQDLGEASAQAAFHHRERANQPADHDANRRRDRSDREGLAGHERADLTPGRPKRAQQRQLAGALREHDAEGRGDDDRGHERRDRREDQHDPRRHRCPQARLIQVLRDRRAHAGHAHARNVAERGVRLRHPLVLGGLRRVFVAVRIRSTGRDNELPRRGAPKDRGEAAVGHVAGGNAHADRVRARGADNGEGAVIALGESRAHFQSVTDLQREGRDRGLRDDDLVVGGRGRSGAQNRLGEGFGGQRRDVEAPARRVGLGDDGPLGHVLDSSDAVGVLQRFFGALDGALRRVVVLGNDDRAALILAVDAGGQARRHRRHDDKGDDDEGCGNSDGQARRDVTAAVGAQVGAQK